MEPLHTKYRPRNFDEVIGQVAACKALDNIIAKESSRAFLFIGPSGCGKTTLARIVAEQMGCNAGNIKEIDAATNTGVDNMRQVTEIARYLPFGASKTKAIVIDECHGLSRQAWDSLLKIVEEGPKHALWFFCTTNPKKVPTTVRTRCTTIPLTLVPEKQIRGLVQEIAGLEKIKLAESIEDMVVKEARGSPRQALVNLATCAGIKDRKEAAELLRTALESDATIELCRFFFQRGSWMKVSAILKKLEDENPEGVRIIVCNYYASVLKNATSERDVKNALSVLDAFSTEYNAAEGMAPLFLSVGRVLYQN